MGTEECNELFGQELAIIFKHSRLCRFSNMAYQTVLEFCADRPDTVIYLISVLDSPDVALFVEQQTGIQHKSPQVIGLQNGKVFNHASHWDITSEFLQRLRRD